MTTQTLVSDIYAQIQRRNRDMQQIAERLQALEARTDERLSFSRQLHRSADAFRDALSRRRGPGVTLKAGSTLERASLTGDGRFTGYGSVFGVVDSYGDVVTKGAFSRTLREWRDKGRLPALLWQHDPREPIGVYEEIREDDHGLYVVGKLSNTSRGQDARTLIRDGALSGLSIGFRTRASTLDEMTGTRTLTDIELFEVSVVTFPANDDARVESMRRVDLRDLVQAARRYAQAAAV